MPSELIKADAVKMILDRLPHVGDRISGQGIDLLPAQIIAFVGFVIDRLPAPGAHMDEEIHPLIAFITVHHTRKEEVLRLDMHTYFLQRFTRGRSFYGFVAIQVPGRDAVLAIAKAGLEPSN